MSKENPGNAVNLLCEGTMIIGDIKAKTDTRIDGMIKGNIETAGRLIIGNTGMIEGNINCNNIDILGVVIGDIQSSATVTLKAPAQMTGNIVANAVSLEPGVIFNGSCKMSGGQKKVEK